MVAFVSNPEVGFLLIAPTAAEKRSVLEEKMKIEEILQAQTEAENFREKVSEITSYIRQTFGTNVRYFIDDIK